MSGRSRVGVRSTGALFAVVSIASTAVVSARPRQAPTPSNAHSIAIDFFAVTPDGSPVTDLSAADVVVSINGHVTPIRSLEWVREAAAFEAADDATGRALGPLLPPPFATNARLPGVRSFYLIVDDDGADGSFAGALSRSIGALLAVLPAQDTVALTTVRNEGPNVPSTTDRRSLTARLTSWPLPTSAGKGAAPTASRAARDDSRVSAVLDAVARANTTSIVILIGRGSTSEALEGPNGRQGGPSAAGLFATARTAEARAQAHLFFVNLAGGNDVLARVARETTAHYVATVMSDDAPGQLMPLAITTSRAAVSVIARPLTESWLVVRSGGDPSLGAAVDSRDEFRQGTIRVAAFSSRVSQASGTIALSVVIEPASGSSSVLYAGAVLMSATGSIVARSLGPPSGLVAPPAVVVSLVAPPGSYHVRAVGFVGDGGGSVDMPVDLGLTSAGPLRLGALALGVAHVGPPAPVATTPARGSRAASVPMPDIRLQFSSERDAVAFFDLYGGTPNQRVTVLFEIRRHANGPPIALLQPTIQPARVGEPDHYLVTAPIDLASLAPGDYEVRATVSLAGQAAGVITRTLRKVKAA